MVIGLWLVWPVRDDWAEPDDGDASSGPHVEPTIPPERLAPASAPLEPR